MSCFFALVINFGSYFMLIAERISGNFLDTSIIAVATCCDPPNTRSPAWIILFPDLTSLPEIPKTFLIFFGLISEKTKFVWHSGIIFDAFLIFWKLIIACESCFCISGIFL